jgi:hypothetical protein
MDALLHVQLFGLEANGQSSKRKNHGMQKCIHPLCLAMLSKVFTKVG